jgi:hypothetical protein
VQQRHFPRVKRPGREAIHSVFSAELQSKGKKDKVVPVLN